MLTAKNMMSVWEVVALTASTTLSLRELSLLLLPLNNVCMRATGSFSMAKIPPQFE